MKKIALVLVSLVLGILFHFAGIILGHIATGVVTRKSPHQIVWLVGGYYIPFLICGMVLAVTHGFQYPRMLVPVCAVTVIGLFIAENPEPSAPTLPEPMLLVVAVPLSFVGCLVAQALRNRRVPNRGLSKTLSDVAKRRCAFFGFAFCVAIGFSKHALPLGSEGVWKVLFGPSFHVGYFHPCKAVGYLFRRRLTKERGKGE